MKFKSIFEERYEKFMTNLVTEATGGSGIPADLKKELGYDPKNPDGIQGWGPGYIYGAVKGVIDYKGLLAEDRAVIEKLKIEDITFNDRSTVPLYCKPETSATNDCPTSVGEAVYMWLDDEEFDKMRERYLTVRDSDKLKRGSIPEIAQQDRKVQVYGLMYAMIDSESTYNPKPHTYKYYRVNMAALDASIGGLTKMLADKDAFIAAVNAIKPTSSQDKDGIIVEYSLEVKKGDASYSQTTLPSKGGTATLDETLCLSESEYNAAQRMLSSVSALRSAYTRAYKKTFADSVLVPISDQVSKSIREGDTPIAVGSQSFFETYPGYPCCLKLSDIIDNAGLQCDTNDMQPLHRNALRSRQGGKASITAMTNDVRVVFGNPGKYHIWVYVWNPEKMVGMPRPLCYDPKY